MCGIILVVCTVILIAIVINIDNKYFLYRNDQKDSTVHTASFREFRPNHQCNRCKNLSSKVEKFDANMVINGYKVYYSVTMHKCSKDLFNDDNKCGGFNELV